MHLLSRSPKRPYRCLILSGLLGLPVGTLLVSAYLAIFQSHSLSQSLTLIADTLPVSLLGLGVLALLLLFYGFPLLWLALRFNLAGPAVALVVALAPGVAALLSQGMAGTLAWLPLSISASVATFFLWFAYREAPPNNSFKPNPLRGSA